MENYEMDDSNDRLDYWLQSKNLYHLKEEVVRKVDALEKAMKDNGVSWSDLKRGQAPEDVLKIKDNLDKHTMRYEGIVKHHLSQDWKKHGDNLGNVFESEYKGKVTTRKQVEEQEARTDEALKAYQNNPNDETRANYIKVSARVKTEAEAIEDRERKKFESEQHVKDYIRNKHIESTARAEASKERVRLKNTEFHKMQEAKKAEALNDIRLRVAPRLPAKTEIDDAIDKRKAEILAEEY